jgi:prepilin-type N-terminal cleavage/methylation domain-containing protein
MNYELRIKDSVAQGLKESAHHSLFLISPDEECAEGEVLRNVRVLAKHEVIHNSAKSAGFSLLETMVALAVLTSAVMGPMSLASTSIRSASLSHDTVMASFLAEEGAEIVRARRDNSIYSGTGWMADLGECTSQDCLVDPFASSPDDILYPCTGACPKIKYDPATGAFQYLTGNEMPFTRVINIIPVGLGDKEVRVVVTVTWRERFLGVDSKVIIDTNLFNWK